MGAANGVGGGVTRSFATEGGEEGNGGEGGSAVLVLWVIGVGEGDGVGWGGVRLEAINNQMLSGARPEEEDAAGRV